MVKRYVWDEEGYPPDGVELVAASDYDSLAAEFSAYKEAHTKSCPFVARIRELEAALQKIAPGPSPPHALLTAEQAYHVASEALALQEVTTRMATAEAIIHAIDFRLGRDGWTLELAQALGYSQFDRGDEHG